jgi:hypothetical protein
MHHADIPIDCTNKLSATGLSHCLKTLGLTDMSNEPRNSAEIAKEQALVEVWASPRYESRWHLGTTAYVRRDTNRWRVTFFPGPPGSSDSIELFSEGFSAWITIHSPEVQVTVDRRRKFDLW